MKKKIVVKLIITVLFLSFAYYLYKSFIYVDISTVDNFKTLEDRITMINYYAYKCMSDKIDSDNQRNKKKMGIIDRWYIKKMFKALPIDQKTFYMIYAGPDNLKFGGPINPWGEFKFFTDVSNFNREVYEFRSLHMKIGHYAYRAFDEFAEFIPKSILLGKMVSIGIGGTYGTADHVALLIIMYIENAIKNNLQDILLLNTILEKHTDKEICAFWFFIFAGPHPKNYEKYYVQLSKYLSPRVSKLMNEAYQYLISQPHCTGH